MDIALIKTIEDDFKLWNDCVKIVAIEFANNNKRRLHGKHAIRRRQLMKFTSKEKT